MTQKLPSRSEIEMVTQDWVRDFASNNQDIVDFPVEELVDIALVSLKAYLKILKIGEKQKRVNSQELKKEILKTIREYENIKVKYLPRLD